MNLQINLAPNASIPLEVDITKLPVHLDLTSDRVMILALARKDLGLQIGDIDDLFAMPEEIIVSRFDDHLYEMSSGSFRIEQTLHDREGLPSVWVFRRGNFHLRIMNDSGISR
jgi:bifunctional DNA-binding transcriptional regulator/antitoxin component of YhaV-PrlF toxin-antitoxin module